MMKRPWAMVAMLLFLASPARAELLTGSGKVKVLLHWEGHSGPLLTLGQMQATEGSCPRNDYYMLPRNHSFFNVDYALILGAMLAGKPIGVLIERGDCVEGLPRISHVYVDER